MNISWNIFNNLTMDVAKCVIVHVLSLHSIVVIMYINIVGAEVGVVLMAGGSQDRVHGRSA